MAAMAVFEDLPPEIRNRIYDDVADNDLPFVPQKALRGRYPYCSRRLRVFTSETTRLEYRAVLAGRMVHRETPVKLMVTDFDFNAATKYIQEREKYGTLDAIVGGDESPCALMVRLAFTKKFDGTKEGVFKWTRFITRFTKKHGARPCVEYTHRSHEDTATVRAFRNGLMNTHDANTEWQRIASSLIMFGFCGPQRFRYTDEAKYARLQDKYAARERDARIKDYAARGITNYDLNEEPELDEDGETKIAPVCLPSGKRQVAAEKWTKKLLGSKHPPIYLSVKLLTIHL